MEAELSSKSRWFRRRNEHVNGATGARKGKRTEQRVDQILSGMTKPVWMLGHRWATAEEDCRGYDFWVETDVGDIPLQVKSSRGGWEEFKRRDEHEMTACIYLRSCTVKKHVIKHLLAELEEIRAFRLSDSLPEPDEARIDPQNSCGEVN